MYACLNMCICMSHQQLQRLGKEDDRRPQRLWCEARQHLFDGIHHRDMRRRPFRYTHIFVNIHLVLSDLFECTFPQMLRILCGSSAVSPLRHGARSSNALCLWISLYAMAVYTLWLICGFPVESATEFHIYVFVYVWVIVWFLWMSLSAMAACTWWPIWGFTDETCDGAR